MTVKYSCSISQFPYYIAICMVLLLSPCCARIDLYEYTGPVNMSDDDMERIFNSEVYRCYCKSPLKILAIGNSFTQNATAYIPYIFDMQNNDSICLAQLTCSGCSLSQHWLSHRQNTEDYEFCYSNCGKWILSDFKTIDLALNILDWDIIVIQQQSGLAGDYSSYGALPNLIQLFRETNPSAKIAWHYTWPYKEGTVHSDFSKYDENPQKMYEAILDAGDKASEDLDIKIPSATLIWEMRQQYPEIEDKFSEDGYHISNDMALFALSSLWYECLVAPYITSSSLDLAQYPEGINPEQFAMAKEIIRRLVGADEDPN